MQLPRGTFRTLKREISLDALTDELKKERFTGYCTISRDSSEIVMVFRNGSLLLARYDDMEGNAAWDRIKGLGSDMVDAVLSNLSDMQVELALEFNSNARIQRLTPRGVRAPVPPVRRTETQQADISSERVIPTTNEPRRSERKPPSPIYEKEVVETNIPSKSDASPSVSSDEEYSGIYQELEALDSMDIDSMTQKIRNNCMVMIEKLHLEHLIETKKERGGR